MDTEALRQSLLKGHAPHLVCGPETELVVEGYPRSANTFSVDMIAVLTELEGGRRMAHHTHSVDQLRLAEALGIPVLVLIRTPAEAILSFRIYSDHPPERCIARYRDFYRAVLSLRAPVAVAGFDEVTGDFNRVLERVNPLLRRPVPLSQDLAADMEKARARELARAERTHGALSTRRIGVPDPAREEIKRQMRAEVAAAVAACPDLARLHAEVLRRGGLTSSPAAG